MADLLKTIICLSLLFLHVNMATAATNKTYTEEDASNKVTIGVYANRILGFSIKDNSFDIDYYLWLRWKGDHLKPHKSIELVNGTQSCQVLSEENKKGFHYVTLRCAAKVTKFWNLTRFPLDSQNLELLFEDNYSALNAFRYVPDKSNSTIGKSFNISGWEVEGTYSQTAIGEYETNFGDPTLSEKNHSQFSRFIFGINIFRSFADTGYAFKLFFPVFIAMFIALLQFFVPVDTSLRFNLAVGSIFASVGASYAITNSLPPSKYMSMAELINLTTSVYVFLCLCGTVYSLYLSKKDESLCKKFDKLFVSLAASFYVGSIAVIIKFW